MPPTWICDGCGQRVILAQAYLEWTRTSRGYGKDFWIVHQADYSGKGRCSRDGANAKGEETPQSLPLSRVVGPAGLTELLSIPPARKLDHEHHLYDVIARLHVDGYEEARAGRTQPGAGPAADDTSRYAELLRSARDLVSTHRRARRTR